jgi:shikimate kinase
MKQPVRHIFLIGMMGSGKSRVGSLLAKRLTYTFIDLDRQIEITAGKSIPEIFGEDGESAFRELETRVAKDTDLSKSAVIATGGGFPLKEANRIWMRQQGDIVWLKADPRTILERIQDEDRPLLPKPVTTEKIEAILKDRLPVYEKAHLQLDTDQRDPNEIAEQIAKWILCKRP